MHKLHDPFLDLVPPQGVKLTRRHYAYLKISEGCNRFCIIPQSSRAAQEPKVVREAEGLVAAGVEELLFFRRTRAHLALLLDWLSEAKLASAASNMRM